MSLLRDKERLGKAIARCQTCVSSVEKYQESLDVKYTPAEQLWSIGQGVQTVASELDKLRQRVSVTIRAGKECEVNLY